MIDSSVVRVHQHASGVGGDRCVGRSRGGLTTKIHARVDAKGRPVRLMITPGEAHDVTCVEALLDGLDARAVVIADERYDADRVRAKSVIKVRSPTFPTIPTERRGSGGRRPSIASATTLSASSTN